MARMSDSPPSPCGPSGSQGAGAELLPAPALQPTTAATGLDPVGPVYTGHPSVRTECLAGPASNQRYSALAATTN
jgi:hypothetical protein